MKKSLLVFVAMTLVLVSACASNPEAPQNASTQNMITQMNTTISEEQAKQAALTHAGLSMDTVNFSKSSFDRDDSKYEIEFYDQASGKTYDYDINATTGEIISFKQKGMAGANSPSGGSVDADQAKKIALDKVPGAESSNIVEFKEDLENGKKVFEGKIVFKNTEYEFEISADTGTVLKWESESVFS